MEQKNPLLQLKQSGVGVGIGRVKRRYKRKNAGSPVKKGPSPVKRHNPGNSPAKTLPSSVRPREMINGLKVSPSAVCSSVFQCCDAESDYNNLFNSHVYPSQTENGPSTSSLKQDIPESLSKFIPRPAPALAGACDLTDIRTLLREWVTTISGIQSGSALLKCSHMQFSKRFISSLWDCEVV